MQLLLGLMAFALLIAFLTILVIGVPRVDLFCLITFTIGLAGWDLVRSIREHKD